MSTDTEKVRDTRAIGTDVMEETSPAKITAIGACVMDTLFSMDRFPTEDTKVYASGVKLSGGGPAATGLCAAAHQGNTGAFIGVLSDDQGGRFLMQDFEKYGVDNSMITVLPGYRSFTSYILLSGESSSRTIILDKGNLPHLTLTDSQKEAICQSQILMIDGNEMDAAEEACQIARAHGTTVLYDCGGLYPGYERLLAVTDLMIPSEEFALKATGTEDVRSAAKVLMDRYHPQLVVITCGIRGGILFDGEKWFEYPAFPVQAVDSNGAGDVFHGAFASGLLHGLGYEDCCLFASATSAIKCQGLGARPSVPDFQEVLDFLAKRGITLSTLKP